MGCCRPDRPLATLIESVPAAEPGTARSRRVRAHDLLAERPQRHSYVPDVVWIGPALFYGGVVQLLAGMWSSGTAMSSERRHSRRTAGSGSGSAPSSSYQHDRTREGHHGRRFGPGVVPLGICDLQHLHAPLEHARERRGDARVPHSRDHRDRARDRLLQPCARGQHLVAARRRLGPLATAAAAWYAWPRESSTA